MNIRLANQDGTPVVSFELTGEALQGVAVASMLRYEDNYYVYQTIGIHEAIFVRCHAPFVIDGKI